MRLWHSVARSTVLYLVLFVILGLAAASMIRLSVLGRRAARQAAGLPPITETLTTAPIATPHPTATVLPHSRLPSPVDTSDPTANWLAYNDPMGYYTLKYPPEWIVLGPVREGAPTVLSSVDYLAVPAEDGATATDEQLLADRLAVFVMLSARPLESEQSITDWTEKSILPHGFEVIRDTEIDVSGVISVQRDYRDNLERPWVVVFIPVNERVLALRGGIIEDKWLDTFDLIVSTVELE